MGKMALLLKCFRNSFSVESIVRGLGEIPSRPQIPQVPLAYDKARFLWSLYLPKPRLLRRFYRSSAPIIFE